MKKKKTNYVVYYVESEGYDSYIVKIDGKLMCNATLATATVFSKEGALKIKKQLNKERTDKTIKWRTKAIG